MEVKKKFIAVLANDIEEDEYEEGSSFYISDIDWYNKEFSIPDNITYGENVYSAIENLGKGCFCSCENRFDTDVKLGGEDGLRKFLKTLPWIIVLPEKDFCNNVKVDPSKISQSIKTEVYGLEDEDEYDNE